MVKLFLKNSNLCDHNSPTSQTDRQTDGQTTCDRNTALCTKVHRAVIKLASLSTLSINTKSTLKSRCAHSNAMWWNQPFTPLSSLPLNWVQIWATFLQSVLTKVLPLTSVWMEAITSHTFHYVAAQVVQVQWLVKSTHYDARCIQWHAVNEQTSRQGQLQHCSFAGAQWVTLTFDLAFR